MRSSHARGTAWHVPRATGPFSRAGRAAGVAIVTPDATATPGRAAIPHARAQGAADQEPGEGIGTGTKGAALAGGAAIGSCPSAAATGWP